MGMVTKKFYCHKCGERLNRQSQTKLLKPGDPDYKKHNRINHRTHMVGDVEVTEYVFQCPSCENRIEYDEQLVLHKIQKRLRKQVLSETDIAENQGKIEAAMDRNARVFKLLLIAITLGTIALVFYFKAKSGDFSFKIHF